MLRRDSLDSSSFQADVVLVGTVNVLADEWMDGSERLRWLEL